MTPADAVDVLVVAIDQVESDDWTPHEYPFWCLGLDVHAGDIFEIAAGDGDDADTVDGLLIALRSSLGDVADDVLDGRRKPAKDSALAVMRSVVEPSRDRFWWFPERL